MAERWYLMPMARGTGPRLKMRGPKYFGVEINASMAPLVDSRPGGWSAMDFPDRDDLCIVHCTDIPDTEHALLDAATDVWDFPADTTRAVEANKRGLFTAFMRAGGLEESRWFRGTMSYGDCIDEILSDCLHRQNEFGRSREIAKGRTARPPRDRAAHGRDIQDLKPGR